MTVAWAVGAAANPQNVGTLVAVPPVTGSLPAGPGSTGTGSPIVAQTTVFTLTAEGTNPDGSLNGDSITQSITVTVPPPDYGQAYVGTWDGMLLESPTDGGNGPVDGPTTTIGNVQVVITEPSLNSLSFDFPYIDPQATSVSCSNGLSVTAGPSSLSFSGTYSCVANGEPSCAGGSLLVTLTQEQVAAPSPNLTLNFWATLSCENGGTAEYVLYQAPNLTE